MIGYQYILVILDYATSYPEATPLQSAIATHIAPELLKVFAKVGVPKENLTDQGTNMTFKLMQERHVHCLKIKH